MRERPAVQLASGRTFRCLAAARWKAWRERTKSASRQANQNCCRDVACKDFPELQVTRHHLARSSAPSTTSRTRPPAPSALVCPVPCKERPGRSSARVTDRRGSGSRASTLLATIAEVQRCRSARGDAEPRTGSGCVSDGGGVRNGGRCGTDAARLARRRAARRPVGKAVGVFAQQMHSRRQQPQVLLPLRHTRSQACSCAMGARRRCS